MKPLIEPEEEYGYTTQCAQFLSQGYTADQLKDWLKKRGVSLIERHTVIKRAVELNEKSKEASLHLQQEESKVTLSDTPPLTHYDLLDTKNFFSFKQKLFNKKVKKNPDLFIQARIELTNGFYKNFIVKQDKGGFYYKDGYYVFDQVSKRYDVDSKMWFYEYHQDFALPVSKELLINEKKITAIHIPLDRKINVKEVKELVLSSGLLEAKYSISPTYLNLWKKDRSAEKIISGGADEDFFKFMKLMIIILLIVGVLNLLIMLQSSGILTNLGGG